MFAEPLLTEQAARRHRFQDAKYALPAAFATCLLIGGSLLLRFDHVPHVEPSMTLKLAAHSKYWHGVSLGGWLLMEINPSERNPSSSPDVRPKWMYDQIEADSEIDFVHGLRAVSDEFAIATMRNHWDGYISDESLDNARALGVDSVRIPVGYWITDVPEGGTSPLEYGFSPEGFVTGGLRHLHALLPKLRARGMAALIDMHALPCNSACVSDGLNCAAPFAFEPSARVSQGLTKCSGGKYRTSRVGAEQETWGDVGVASVRKLALWISQLPEEDAAVIVALQLGNEPALNSKGYDAAVKVFYTAAAKAVSGVLPSLPLVMSFIPPNDVAVPAFVKELGAQLGGDTPLLIDHHWYLNWASPEGVALDWSELHTRACHEAVNSWSAYTSAEVPLLLGEWSLATNHDAPLDLEADASVRAELRQLFQEQLGVFASSGVVGAFFWTLRMGSGWDPRPSPSHPRGRHVGRASPTQSLPGYPFRVWSLLELAALGIATPINKTAAARANSCQKEAGGLRGEGSHASASHLVKSNEPDS